MKSNLMSVIVALAVLLNLTASTAQASGDDGCRLTYYSTEIEDFFTLQIFKAIRASLSLPVIEAAYDHPRFEDPNPKALARMHRKIEKHCPNITYEEVRSILRDLDMDRSLCKKSRNPGDVEHFVLSRAQIQKLVLKRAREQFSDRCS